MRPNRLRKSSQEKMVFGVAGGLADYFNIDPVLVRLAFVLTIFAGGVGLIAYVVLAIIMPRQESSAARPADVVRENWQSMGQEAAEAAHRVEEVVRGAPSTGEQTETPETPTEQGEESRRHIGLGTILVVLGVVFLLGNLNALWWFRWSILWPVVFILAGLAIIIGRIRRN